MHVESVKPYSCLQLEAAATVGVAVILAVLGIIVQTSVHAGLPAIKSGELPLWKFEVSNLFPPLLLTHLWA